MKKVVVVDLRSSHHLVQKVVPSCPTCKHTIDGATGGGKAPAPGDVSICLYCGTIGQYEVVPGGMQVKALKDEEIMSLPVDLRIQLGILQKGVMGFKKKI